MGKRSFEEVIEDILLELASLSDVFSVNDIASKTGINYRTAQRALNIIYRVTSSGVLQKAKHSGRDLWIWKPRRSYIEAKAMIILQELFEKEKLSIKEIAEKYGWEKEVIEEAVDYLIRRTLARKEGDFIAIVEPWRYLRDYMDVRKRILKELKKAKDIVILKPINIDIEYVVISNGKPVAIVYIPIATKRNIEKIKKKTKHIGIEDVVIVADEAEVRDEKIILVEEIDKLKEKIMNLTKIPLTIFS